MNNLSTSAPPYPSTSDPNRHAPHDPAPAGGPGRPSTRTPDKLYAVCSFIRMTGVSDTTAAALAGVTRSTISRWKAENEEAACELDKARAEYLLPRLKIIGETLRKDGELDWRAQAWLIKFANPEEYGPPSRRRKLKEVEVPPTEEELRLAEEAEIADGRAQWYKYKRGGVVTGPMQKALFVMRQESIRRMEPEWYDAQVAKEKADKEAADSEPTLGELAERHAQAQAAAAKAEAERVASMEARERAEAGERAGKFENAHEDERATPEKRTNSSRNSSGEGDAARSAETPRENVLVS